MAWRAWDHVCLIWQKCRALAPLLTPFPSFSAADSYSQPHLPGQSDPLEQGLL